MGVDVVIILAAGQGTRMKSSLPKVLHDMCGRTLLGHVIETANEIDPKKIVVVVRHEAEKVAEHARECLPDVLIAHQDDIPGTGRAVWCALEELQKTEKLQGKCLVVAGDTPLIFSSTLKKLAENSEGNAVTVLTTVLDDATGYGRMKRDAQGQVCAIVEHKDASEEERAIKEVNTSTYVFDMAFLYEALQSVDTNNSQGEMYLTDVLEKAYESGAGVGAYVVEDSTQVQGCNTPEQLEELRNIMRSRTQ
ncbi:MAG: NTP transferase domain-containing protein [Actinomycetaceae bacterium]|nr:NTP transferase domain-containing protein [Actinomycetaceae bacterium]